MNINFRSHLREVLSDRASLFKFKNMTEDRTDSIIGLSDYSEVLTKSFQERFKEITNSIKNLDKTVIIDRQVEVEKAAVATGRGSGARHNEGKLRYDLFEPYAMEQLAKVFTKGAEKYAPRNWEQGMAWSKVTASLKRHMAAIERGEDYDAETGLLHSAHVAWNAMALTSYYKLYPQGDDRQHHYLNMPKIGLDIDDVVCNWVEAWCEKHEHGSIPEVWNFSYKNKERFEALGEDMNEFYLNLPAKISPNDIPFEPHCWITSRSVPKELTEAWLEKNNFPTVPVYSVGFGKSKVEVAKESGIDIFVDDRYENFVELNNAGICTFLLTAPHNKRYEVGYKRVDSLKELFERFK